MAKLKDTHTNDTFCRRDRPVHMEPIPYPEAVATSGVVVKNRGEEDKLAAGLHKLHEEDPTFHFEYSSELHQTLIHGMGERHFEILLGRLEKKFGVHAELIRPRVAYRETLEGQGARARASTRSRAVAGASTATAGSVWRPARAARGTSSWTTSWAG